MGLFQKVEKEAQKRLLFWPARLARFPSSSQRYV